MPTRWTLRIQTTLKNYSTTNAENMATTQTGCISFLAARFKNVAIQYEEGCFLLGLNARSKHIGQL